MNTETDLQVHSLPVGKIKKFISRAREKAGWEAMRDSMADVGLKVPIEVRDIRDWKREDRRNADGTICDFELVKGEGRLEAAIDLGWKTIPGFIKDAPEIEIVGRFLAENLIRTPLAWAQRGKMIRDQIKDGAELKDVAASLHISPNLAAKYLRVLDKAAPELADEVAAMPVNDAEVLTALPAKGQKFVMEVVRETGATVRDVAKRAQHLTASKGEAWTKAELHKAITRIDDDLEKVKKRLKMLRLHSSLGPQNLEILLSRPDFQAAVKKAGVNVAKFEEEMAK